MPRPALLTPPHALLQLENVIEERIALTDEPMEPHTFDLLMQDGWRLLGNGFLRHNATIWQNHQVRTVPLRIRLENFFLSKSQRQVVRRNADLQIYFGQSLLDSERHDLFRRHTRRFTDNVPDSLHSFFHEAMFMLPVSGGELAVYFEDKLLACSYIHMGKSALNSTYAFFDPEYARRSLGIFTLLVEAMYALNTGRRFYYLGYAYDEPSQMDYKRNFHGLEAMDWETGQWIPLPRRGGFEF